MNVFASFQHLSVKTFEREVFIIEWISLLYFVHVSTYFVRGKPMADFNITVIPKLKEIFSFLFLNYCFLPVITVLDFQK